MSFAKACDCATSQDAPGIPAACRRTGTGGPAPHRNQAGHTPTAAAARDHPGDSGEATRFRIGALRGDRIARLTTEAFFLLTGILIYALLRHLIRVSTSKLLNGHGKHC